MIIQIDSREKARAIVKIVEEFDKRNILHPVSKLMVGDYMNYDNPRVIVDRKQDMTELCGNIFNDHKRFRNELLLAQKHEIKLIILIEHGKGLTELKDLIWWKKKPVKRRIFNQDTKQWDSWTTKEIDGLRVYKTLTTMRDKYGCEFLFCEKKDTGKRIIELLGG